MKADSKKSDVPKPPRFFQPDSLLDVLANAGICGFVGTFAWVIICEAGFFSARSQISSQVEESRPCLTFGFLFITFAASVVGMFPLFFLGYLKRMLTSLKELSVADKNETDERNNKG